MSVCGGVSQTLLPLRNEVPSSLCLVGGQGQGPCLCLPSVSTQSILCYHVSRPASVLRELLSPGDADDTGVA